MRFLSSFQFIFALFIILWGFSLLLSAIFKINIPLARIFIGLLLVIFGINIIFFNSPFCVFGKKIFNSNIVIAKSNQIDIAFTNDIIDFSKLTDEEKGKIRKINVGFSNLEIILDDNEYYIDIESGFSSVITPNSSFSFGENSYISKSDKENKKTYRFRISAGFSRININVNKNN